MLQRYSRRILLCAIVASPSLALAQAIDSETVQPALRAEVEPSATVFSSVVSRADCAAGTQLSQDTATSSYPAGNTATTAGGPQELGQSFVAPCDGTLGTIQLALQNPGGTQPPAQDVNFTFQVFEGAGTAGTELSSEDLTITLPGAGFFGRYDIAIPGNVQVVEGNVYTFFVDVTSQTTIGMQGNNTAPYADGEVYVSNSGSSTGAGPVATIDLRFIATFQPMANTAAEAPAQGVVSLSPVRPNPARGEAALELSSGISQEVTVTLYDALGREVVVLFEGRVSSGVPVPVLLKAGSLPSGVYHVRALGESFVSTQRVTIAR